MLDTNQRIMKANTKPCKLFEQIGIFQASHVSMSVGPPPEIQSDDHMKCY